MSATATDVDVKGLIDSAFEDVFAVLVLNDDVTTFEQVIIALVELFDHSPENALRLAVVVHETGKAVVHVCGKDEAEAKVVALHQRLIQATYTAA